MVPLIVPIGALLCGAALLLLGVGLLNTIVALRSNIEGYSDATLGIIMSSYFVGFFIGTFVALPLVRRVGHIRAFASCASIVSICVLMHQLVVSVPAWIIFRIVTGVCLVILYTVIEGWLNGQTPAENRGRVFAIYMTVNLGAMALAQQFLLLDPSITFLLFALSSILVSVSLVPVTWTRMQQPVVSKVSGVPLRRLWKTAPVALIGSVLSGLAMGAFWGLTAAYANRMGMTTSQVASFMAAGIIGGALFQFPIGRYSDRQDRRKVLLYVALAAALMAVALIATSSIPAVSFVFIALYGGAAFAVYPVAVAHLVDHLDPEDMLAGGSGMLLLHGIGAMIGPLVAGQVMQLFGAISLPAFWVAMQIGLAACAWFYIANSKAENPEDHAADFVPMVRTTPTALEMLPVDEQGEYQEGQAPVWGAEPDAAGVEGDDDDDLEAPEAAPKNQS